MVTREINQLIQLSDESYGGDLADSREDPSYNLNLSRKAAMRNIWIQLSFISVASIETFLYSIFRYYMTGEHCVPIHTSSSVNSWIEFLNRFCEYQLRFIPLIWLYWPTKTHKKQNMRRVRAAKALTNTTKRAKHSGLQNDTGGERTEKNDSDDDGYASLDGESYLDYDSQSDISDNEGPYKDSSRGSIAR